MSVVTGLPRRRFTLVIGGSALLLALALLGAPLVGSTRLDLSRVLADPLDWGGNSDAAIFFIARLPRVLLACLVGGSFALSGATFQAVLRNPLATPYTLGVSAGAMLASFLTISYAPTPALAELTVPVAALAGGVATTLVVVGLAGRRAALPASVLLLAGVTLNFTIGAVVMLLQYFADFAEIARMVRWTMGDLDAATYRMLGVLALGSLPAWLVLTGSGRAFNLLSLGVEEARAHGIDADRARRHSLLWAAWLTGLSVAFAGPVGFVGIIVPHALRLLGGADYRVILPASAVAGGAFLILCDAAARTVIAPVQLPIGVITACLGGPFFLLLLLRRRAGGVL